MNYINIIQDLVLWIEKNIDKPLSVDHVSEKSGYSKWHLQRMFKSVTNNILGTYIRERRLTYAALALRLTNRPILEIAIQYQFDSQQTFTRAFKKQFNETPANYRRMPLWNPAGITSRLELKESTQLTGYVVTLKKMQLEGIQHNFNCPLPLFSQKKTELRYNFWYDYFESCKNQIIKLPKQVYGIITAERSKTNFDEQNIYYTTAIDKYDYPICSDGKKLNVITLNAGKYIRFDFQGDPEKYEEFVIQIYTQALPKLKVMRCEGPDIECFPLDNISLDSGIPTIITAQYYIPIL